MPENWTVQRLKGMRLKEVMQVFASLSAPEFGEMNGEYSAVLLDHGGGLTNLVSALAIDSPLFNGMWLCKSFTPESDTEGWGYNSFRKNGKIVRKFPMKTRITPSRYDGRDCFQLYYPAYKSLLRTIHMVDELRKVRDGLYLGVGTWGWTKKMKMRPLPFVLSGPPEPFVGVDAPPRPA